MGAACLRVMLRKQEAENFQKFQRLIALSVMDTCHRETTSYSLIH